MLTTVEQNNLYVLISSILGEDQGIKNYKSSFSEKTSLVVEDMIKANVSCNKGMSELLKKLISGGKSTTKGWLKRSLKGLGYIIKNEKMSGYGCLVSTKSRWKSAIIMSTI